MKNLKKNLKQDSMGKTEKNKKSTQKNKLTKY